MSSEASPCEGSFVHLHGHGVELNGPEHRFQRERHVTPLPRSARRNMFAPMGSPTRQRPLLSVQEEG